MRVSSMMFVNNYLPQLNQLQAEQNQLESESSTGLSVTEPEDNPLVMNQTLNLQNDVANNTQYQSNIAGLQSTASQVSDVLSQLQPLLEQATTTAISATNVTGPGNLTNDAQQITSIIQQVVQLGNTKDSNGNYLFGGTNVDTPPFVATTDANGNVTGVTYQGNTSVNSVNVSASLTMSAQVLGANTTGSGPQGLLIDSGSGVNVFNDLIQLQQDLASGNTTAVNNTDLPAVSKDHDHIVNQVSANGVIQSALESMSTGATQRGTTLSTQISNDTSADLATTLTKLSQAQTAYQAALESGVLVMNLSILQYIQ